MAAARSEALGRRSAVSMFLPDDFRAAADLLVRLCADRTGTVGALSVIKRTLAARRHFHRSESFSPAPTMLAWRTLTGATRTRARALCSSPKGVGYKDGLEYSQRMDKTGRPISPHVFIYRFPTIAISSILVRITGGMATFGFFGVAGLTMIGGGEYAIRTVQDVADVAPTAAKFSIAYVAMLGLEPWTLHSPTPFTSPAFEPLFGQVLSYQWLGSARHLYWDWTARGFNNQVMYQGALAMFGVTAVLSAALAAYSLPPAPKCDKEKKAH